MKDKFIVKLISVVGLVVIGILSTKKVLGLSLSIYIPEKYLEVKAGERLAFEINVKYPENPSRKDLRLTYQIKKGEEVISESKTLKAIETQSSFMDYMVIPESLEVGTYTISDRIQDYKDLNEEISADFRVVKGKEDLMKYIYILGAAVGIVFLFVIVEMFVILRLKSEIKT